ncbi:MAG: ATP synthase F1 subunit gamma [Coriobacteriales bacterium]|nr:ATP synthase F1 subunit gamma [Coriobacteriales bacterium]
MANLREIKARIDSVKSTMQVTRTMEMISTAKIRRALDRAQQAEPYKEAITLMLSHVASASTGGEQPLLQRHAEEKCVLFVLIASDRGMAGGFNIQPQRMVQREMEALEEKGVECQLITAGRRPTEYFTFRGRKPVVSIQGNSSEPTMDDANRIASYIIDGYVSGEIDRVVIYYSHARNRVDQELVHEQILPVTTEDLIMPNQPREHEAVSEIDHRMVSVYSFEPSPSVVLGYLMPAYIRTIVLHALLDSAAAEHGARRRAMQSATDNAKEVITALSRTYNRERQGSITTELNEIIAGASALEDK